MSYSRNERKRLAKEIKRMNKDKNKKLQMFAEFRRRNMSKYLWWGKYFN